MSRASLSRSQRSTGEASELTSGSGGMHPGRGDQSCSLGLGFGWPSTGIGLPNPGESALLEAGPRWDWVGGQEAAGGTKDPGKVVSQHTPPPTTSSALHTRHPHPLHAAARALRPSATNQQQKKSLPQPTAYLCSAQGFPPHPPTLGEERGF